MSQTGRDVIGWFGLVLSNYAHSMRYGLDPSTGTGLVDQSKQVYDSCVAMHETVGTFLDRANASRSAGPA